MILAAVHHHFRILPVLLLLVIVGGAIFLAVRASERRRRNRPPGPPGEGRGAPAMPPVAPTERAGAGTAVPEPPSGSAGAPAGDGRPSPAPSPVSRPPATTPTTHRRTTAAMRARAAAGEWAVETHGLTKRFGTTVAVDNVELLVPRGSAFGYLGPNGAGKTTLIRTLLGLTKADGGTMALLGVPVPHERARALSRIGAIVDEPRFHAHLTGRQNLALLAAARGSGADARIAPSLERVELTGRADDPVSDYSMGMRQRLGVAACLLADPELLILDEPMNGLDPAGMQDMRNMIGSLVDEGRTVMLSSHLLDEVERTCDAVAIVDRGQVIRQGPIEDLVRRANVVVEVDCGDPEAAARAIRHSGLATDVSVGPAEQPHGHAYGGGDGRAPTPLVTVTLPEGATRATVAEIPKILVGLDIPVYGLHEVRTSLQDWFLSVTSRLGAPT